MEGAEWWNCLQSREQAGQDGTTYRQGIVDVMSSVNSTPRIGVLGMGEDTAATRQQRGVTTAGINSW